MPLLLSFACRHILAHPRARIDSDPAWQGFSFSEITLWRALQPPGSSLSVVGAKNGPGISSKHLIACFRHDLAQHVFDLLEEKKTVTAAVDLAMQFRTMAREHFQNEGVLHRLLDIGQLPLAEQWAAQTSRPFVVCLYTPAWLPPMVMPFDHTHSGLCCQAH